MSATEAVRPRPPREGSSRDMPSRDMPSRDREVFLTLTVGGQLCCVPVQRVRDVLLPQATTPIPLAPPEIAGSLNLRGRIVTAMDLRRRLRLPPRPTGAPGPMAVVVEQGSELYALLVDGVGDVVPLALGEAAPNPPTLEPVWRETSRGVFRGMAGEEGQLLILLDVDRLLAIG